MPDQGVIASATLQVRARGKNDAVTYGFSEVPVEVLFAAGPWRTFRWHLGQARYSGAYWSATEADLVVYESRLELARLLYADFDPRVRRIIAQPFRMTAHVDGATRAHVPDYLLLADTGPVVVDVKPAHRLSKEEVAFTFAWSRKVIESRGWGYQVWSEPPVAELENLRFLAGFRREWLFAPEILEALDRAELDGAPLAEAFAMAPEFDSRLARASVFHQMWAGRLTTDLKTPLGPGHVLRRAV
ncbi:TnsA-like heteromeric transposase endonuclease subunit [Nonomuraea sp. NPDC026600]|uniref:TnsA-like heteromeric transposase endonuclease subunit n=1 Tax=Nonomuraea sp. NPDC026600 TaxID=3155363 RepID=UPI0033F42861